jgi:hypothetical protein
MLKTVVCHSHDLSAPTGEHLSAGQVDKKGGRDLTCGPFYFFAGILAKRILSEMRFSL